MGASGYSRYKKYQDDQISKRFESAMQYMINLGTELSYNMNQKTTIRYRSLNNDLILMFDNQIIRCVTLPKAEVLFPTITIYPSGFISPNTIMVNKITYTLSMQGKLTSK